MMDGKNSFPNPQFMTFHQEFSPGNGYSGDGQAELDLGTPSHQAYDPTGARIMNDQQGFPNATQQESTTSKSFWTIEYYQKYFNVTTSDVIDRLKGSIMPTGVENYISTHIRPNPDLFGPFWVCVTLIFAIAISGNVANYFQSASSGNYHWKYEFHIVSKAATCIFLYAWLLPLILWGTLSWYKAPSNPDLMQSMTTVGLLELICLYGYSLAIFIPVAFLWTIQIQILQWTLVLVSALLSGGVLIRSLLPVIPVYQKPIYIAVVLGLHFLLAVGFMEYFFHVPSSHHSNDLTTPASVNIVSSTVKSVMNNATHSGR